MRFTCLLLAIAASVALVFLQAQIPIDFDLEVEVVMDSVLYDDLEGSIFEDVPPVPAGFKRHRLYAIIPEGLVAWGLAADDVVVPPVPGFGFDAPCGCYNYEGSPISPNGINNGSSISPVFLSLEAQLAFDSWWTVQVDQYTEDFATVELPDSFSEGFDMCMDTVVQGGIFTFDLPVSVGVGQGAKVLIGQITTCGDFSFQACMALFDPDAPDFIYSCTNGHVMVPDLCAPVHDADVVVEGGTFSLVSDELAPSVRCRLAEWQGEVIEEQFGGFDWDVLPSGLYTMELYDTATTAAWSSNTCRNLIPFGVGGDGDCPLVWGCTLNQAVNYDPDATVDDGSCLLLGCLDTAAANFNPYANLSDGSCIEDFGSCPGDLNADGLVSVADLVIFLQNFGTPCGLVDQPCSPVTFDGYSYDVVEIGDQCWFAENLRTTVYSSGEQLTEFDDWSGDWNAPFSIIYGQGGFDCVGSCDPVLNLEAFGRLYSQAAIDGPLNLCPSGWHVSTREDWQDLEIALGGDGGIIEFDEGQLQQLLDSEQIGSCLNTAGIGFNARFGGVFGLWPGEFGENGMCCGSGYFSLEPAQLFEHGFYGVPSLPEPQFWAPIWLGCDWGGEEAIGNDNAYSIRCIKN